MYRSLTMIYIVCVIHVVYWRYQLSEPIKSILLFEMPVIFFISGASLSLTHTRKSFVAMLKGRFKRVIWPFIVYIALSCLVVLGLSLVRERSLAPLTMEGLMYDRTLSLFRDIPYLFHLWFILPYVVVYCLFWFEQRLGDHINRHVLLIGAVVFWIVCSLIPLELLNQVAAYNIFFVAGYCYYKKCSNRLLITLLLICCGFLTILLLWKYEFAPMQTHKFPAPDAVFVWFGGVMLCVLAIIFKNITIPANRVLRHWNVEGYNIYLWQNWVFFIIDFTVIALFPQLWECHWAICIILVVVTFIVASIISYLMSFTKQKLFSYFTIKSLHKK